MVRIDWFRIASKAVMYTTSAAAEVQRNLQLILFLGIQPWISNAVRVVSVPFIFWISPNADSHALVVDRIHRGENVDKGVQRRENARIRWREEQ